NPRPREKTTSFCGSRILSRASRRVACPGTIYAVLTQARCAGRAWERYVERLPRARRERPRRNRSPAPPRRSRAQQPATPIPSSAVGPSPCGVLLVIRFWDRVGSVSALFLGRDRRRWCCEEHAEICYRSRACGVHVKNIGCRRSVMHAVIRSYSGKGTKALFDVLVQNKVDVESLILVTKR